MWDSFDSEAESTSSSSSALDITNIDEISSKSKKTFDSCYYPLRIDTRTSLPAYSPAASTLTTVTSQDTTSGTVVTTMVHAGSEELTNSSVNPTVVPLRFKGENLIQPLVSLPTTTTNIFGEIGETSEVTTSPSLTTFWDEPPSDTLQQSTTVGPVENVEEASTTWNILQAYVPTSKTTSPEFEKETSSQITETTISSTFRSFITSKMEADLRHETTRVETKRSSSTGESNEYSTTAYQVFSSSPLLVGSTFSASSSDLTTTDIPTSEFTKMTYASSSAGTFESTTERSYITDATDSESLVETTDETLPSLSAALHENTKSHHTMKRSVQSVRNKLILKFKKDSECYMLKEVSIKFQYNTGITPLVYQ